MYRLHCLFLVVVAPFCHGKSHLRPTKKYLRCNVERYGCWDSEDRVNLCHFNGKEFVTMCVKSRSSIVEHLHAQDYCGECVETSRTPFETTQELQEAVKDYLGDKSTHKRLSAKYGYPIGQWDVSRIQDFSHLFAQQVKFNEDITTWDLSSATSLHSMFKHAHRFNQQIGNWNVEKVESMKHTFYGAESFQADLSHWNTLSLTDMEGTFWRAISFNTPLNSWNVSQVQTMKRTFTDATSFNQPLHNWNTTACQDMSLMFHQATAFQQDLSNWKVHNVHTFERMFSKAPYFQDGQVQTNLLQSWNLRKGADVTHMFTAPRDMSLRAQQLESMQLDVRAILRETTRTYQQRNATRDEPQDPDADQALSREILCHGGVCM